MNLAIALTAARHGAAIANYTEVVHLLKKPDPKTGQEKICGARCRDMTTGEICPYRKLNDLVQVSNGAVALAKLCRIFTDKKGTLSIVNGVTIYEAQLKQSHFQTKQVSDGQSGELNTTKSCIGSSRLCNLNDLILISGLL